jgi:hypothetical protein
MARWLLPFRAINPKNLDSSWEIGVSERHYRYIQNHGHEKQIARLVLVQEVLEGGTVNLYKGWSRPEKEDSFVYEGRPTRDFKSLTIETPAPVGLVFLVFVLPDGEVDEWTWRPLTEDGGKQPDGIKGALIWSASPS